MLTARKLIQGTLLDVESGIRGVLRSFGLKVGSISHGRFAARISDLVDGHATLEGVIEAMLSARTALETEFKRLHRALLALVRDGPVCRQLMSVPGVGAIVAITFKSGVDDPSRFKHSRDVGPDFGLTPRKYQSGELDVTGSISKVGDRMDEEDVPLEHVHVGDLLRVRRREDDLTVNPKLPRYSCPRAVARQFTVYAPGPMSERGIE